MGGAWAPSQGWCAGRVEEDAPVWHPASCIGVLPPHGGPLSQPSTEHAAGGLGQGGVGIGPRVGGAWHEAGPEAAVGAGLPLHSWGPWGGGGAHRGASVHRCARLCCFDKHRPEGGATLPSTIAPEVSTQSNPLKVWKMETSQRIALWESLVQ